MQSQSFQHHVLLKSFLQSKTNRKFPLFIQWGKISGKVGKLVTQNSIIPLPKVLVPWNMLIMWFWFFSFSHKDHLKFKLDYQSLILHFLELLFCFVFFFPWWQWICLFSENSLCFLTATKSPRNSLLAVDVK